MKNIEKKKWAIKYLKSIWYENNSVTHMTPLVHIIRNQQYNNFNFDSFILLILFTCYYSLISNDKILYYYWPYNIALQNKILYVARSYPLSK